MTPINRTIFARSLLPITLMLVSAASMALEIIAGRALAPYVGMSLYSWTVIIAVVLTGLSIGHWIGGIISDRYTALKTCIAATLCLAALTTLFSLWLLKAMEPYVSGLNPVQHISWLAIGAFFLPSTFAGIISPILTKLALDESDTNNHGRVLGLMFALGAFGAIIGTLLAGLVFISWIGTSRSVIIISILYGILSLPFWPKTSRVITSIVLIVVSTLGLHNPKSLGLENSCLVETSYFCVRVDDIVFNGRESRLLALDHLAHGVNDQKDPSFLLSAYVQGVDEIVSNRFTKNDFSAFFIGGGAYTLPRAWHESYPDGSFVIAELDPTVTKIATERLWYKSNNNTEVLHGDARLILSSLPETKKFDVIFGDAFHDISIPPHLVSDEFHQLVKARLSNNGLYAINVVDGFRKPAFLLSLVKTLQKQFQSVELWLDFESVPAYDGRVTWIVIASKSPTSTPTFASQNGLYREWARAPIKRMTEIIGDENIITLTDDYAPVDRLLSKVLLDADLIE